MRRIWMVVSLALVLGIGVAMPAVAGQKPPNVVLVVIDSFRRDHVGCFGYARATTPAIDRLAAEGVRFDDAVAASGWTMPGMGAIFTSLPPSLHGGIDYNHRLAEGLTTIAVEFRKHGYETAGVTANPTTATRFGFAKGFDYYDDFTVALGLAADTGGDREVREGEGGRSTNGEVTRSALGWLGGWNGRKPFFLHVFYFDPHYDYVPPEPYDRMFTDPAYTGHQDGRGIRALGRTVLPEEDRRHILDLYDGEVRSTDDNVGQIVEELKKRGVYDNTLIVVTADHGEEFWDHGGTTHGNTLYEELVRVPLVMRYGGKIKPGTVVRAQTAHIDLMPTILRLAGIDAPAQCLGRDAFSVTNERAAWMETQIQDRITAVRAGGRKVIRHVGETAVEFYDLSADPREQRNMAGKGVDGDFLPLVVEMDRWTALLKPQQAKEPVVGVGPIDPDLLRRLRSLGYVR